VLGSGGLLLIGVAAVRWTRRRPGAAVEAAAVRTAAKTDADLELEARLDDELRDLD